MKIGVIGLGNIFQKAYLPVLAENREGHEFYFASSNQLIKERLAEAYGFQHLYDTLDDLINLGIDACFIHSATVAHVALVKQCLEAGVHVYIDKPLSETQSETEALLALAESKDLILMLGFNRRFAPAVETLKQLPDKRVIYLEKNRIKSQYPTKFAIYDLFLHLVDTAVYLLDREEITIVGLKIVESETLEYLTLQLETDKTTVFLTMDMVSGANTELYRVTTKTGIYTVKNLSEMSQQQSSDEKIMGLSDWQGTLIKRGFEPMILTFLAALKTGERSQLRQQCVVKSHQICHLIEQKIAQPCDH